MFEMPRAFAQGIPVADRRFSRTQQRRQTACCGTMIMIEMGARLITPPSHDHEPRCAQLVGVITISTLRFSARPAAVVFVAIGS